MTERRKHNRVKIPLPVRLKAIDSGIIKVLDLTAKDISFTGVFIPTLSSFPEGTLFELDFTLPHDDLEEFKDIESLKGCQGKAVRSHPHGIAIHFERECQIENLKAL
jgi:hypothetical protein